MKGFLGRSMETHLIAMKAAGQLEIFMFAYIICDNICMQHVQNRVCQISNKPPINTPM